MEFLSTAANLADEVFLIPQFGMVQSLNVSVATAVIVYEALRQRFKKECIIKVNLMKKHLIN